MSTSPEHVASSHWIDLAKQKLERVLGPTKAAVTLAEVLQELGLQTLHSPEHLALFGQTLARRGGFLSPLGTSLQTQALMHRARESI